MHASIATQHAVHADHAINMSHVRRHALLCSRRAFAVDTTVVFPAAADNHVYSYVAAAHATPSTLTSELAQCKSKGGDNRVRHITAVHNAWSAGTQHDCIEPYYRKLVTCFCTVLSCMIVKTCSGPT